MAGKPLRPSPHPAPSNWTSVQLCTGFGRTVAELSRWQHSSVVKGFEKEFSRWKELYGRTGAPRPVQLDKTFKNRDWPTNLTPVTYSDPIDVCIG